MRILRFGASLLTLTLALTAMLFSIVLAAFFSSAALSGFMLAVPSIVSLTVPVTLWATLAAWRWQRRAVFDGIALMVATGLVFAVLLSHGGGPQFGYIAEMVAWGSYIIGLPSAILAYLTSLYLLRRSPLLAPAANANLAPEAST